MTTLFSATPSNQQPLADALRPQDKLLFYGQDHLLAESMPLQRLLNNDMALHSMLFWGPPGCGKTTFAQLLAKKNNVAFFQVSAVTAGVKDIRDIVKQAEQIHQDSPERPRLLFIDECHHFNKTQQDALLPYIENGLFIFIGATTENPSFEMNNALLSRLTVYSFKALNPSDLAHILQIALEHKGKTVSEQAREKIIDFADGDARRLLNITEQLICSTTDSIELEAVDKILTDKNRQFDNGGDHFYNLTSALHKSIRGSNPDAALYWFCRLLDGGADPRYIGRRLLRIASEDIGLADPRALSMTTDANQAYRQLGSPEGELALAQAATYLACAPKSDAVYRAFNQTNALIKKESSRPVPKHLCNAPTQLMRNQGYSKGYRHAHNEKNAYASNVHYFPDDMPATNFYTPTSRGLEKSIKEHLAQLRKTDQS